MKQILDSKFILLIIIGLFGEFLKDTILESSDISKILLTIISNIIIMLLHYLLINSN